MIMGLQASSTSTTTTTPLHPTLLPTYYCQLLGTHQGTKQVKVPIFLEPTS